MDMAVTRLMLALLLNTGALSKGLYNHNNESRILSKIFKDYDRGQLPAASGEKITVKLGFTLKQLVEVEEIKEHVVVNVWIRQEWTNSQLAWNASEFGGVTNINVKPNSVWLPDVRLFANLLPDKHYNGFLDTSLTMVQLFNTGKQLWLIPIIFRIYCHINVADFPFDQQRCDFEFGSWTYDISFVDMKPENDSADLTNYAENEEWHLLSMDAVRNEYKYICCERPFAVVNFVLKIKRKPLFCILNLLAPSALFSWLSLVVYMIPSEAAERASFAVNWLLAMAFFMTNAVSILPDGSESIPIFSRFQGLTLINMFFLIVTLCYTLSLHYANVRVARMPPWVRKYILGRLSKVLRVHTKVCSSERMADAQEMAELLSRPLNHGLDASHPGRLWRPDAGNDTCARLRLEQSLFNDEELCENVSAALMLLIKSKERQQEMQIRKDEWRAVACTLDSLCAVVFTLSLVVITIYCAT